jgi:hypothetical protein
MHSAGEEELARTELARELFVVVFQVGPSHCDAEDAKVLQEKVLQPGQHRFNFYSSYFDDLCLGVCY